MVKVLYEADLTTMGEAVKKHKVSEPMIYAWRKHFVQMDAADVIRLKALESETSMRPYRVVVVLISLGKTGPTRASMASSATNACRWASRRERNRSRWSSRPGEIAPRCPD
jgi:hypothetical protein